MKDEYINELMTLIANRTQTAVEEFAANNERVIFVAGKKVEFAHTAVNGDMHLFIDGYHDPDVCPECIEPGILVEQTQASGEVEL
jgi:hypothetical protein